MCFLINKYQEIKFIDKMNKHYQEKLQEDEIKYFDFFDGHLLIFLGDFYCLLSVRRYCTFQLAWFSLIYYRLDARKLRRRTMENSKLG